jgi:hypothetical protein
MFHRRRFSDRTFPELERFEDDAKAAIAWKRAIGEVPPASRIICVVLVFAGMSAVLVLGEVWWSKAVPGSDILHRPHAPLPGVVFFGMSPLLAGLILGCLYRRSLRRSLRRQLNALSKPTCMKCGYNLTGNVSGICPECGTACPAAAAAPRAQL